MNNKKDLMKIQRQQKSKNAKRKAVPAKVVYAGKSNKEFVRKDQFKKRNKLYFDNS